jgi:hypothetical protein
MRRSKHARHCSRESQPLFSDLKVDRLYFVTDAVSPRGDSRQTRCPSANERIKNSVTGEREELD